MTREGREQLPTRARCPECHRVFDLLDEVDAEEWAYGHDCEPRDKEVDA
jgi:hypothetical protein